MTLKQIFVNNLKILRKKEGFSQMKLAEYCDTAPSYIGDIEIGRRFPSIEMIEKMADALKIEPYHLFKKPEKNNDNFNSEQIFPSLPNSMKRQIKTQIITQLDHSANEIINEILEKY